MAEKTERRYLILTLLRSFFRKLKEALSDLLPIIVVITVFKLAILRQPFPELLEVLMGVALVVIGLMLFVQGLEMGLFPIGEALAVAFARKGSLVWLLIFGFGLGFSTTVAEPALIAITREAAKVAAQADIIVVIQTIFAPKAIIPLAYDSGGVTTSTVTVPLVAALGLGLSATIPGRNPALDGFGLIAFASLFPIITVMGYAQFTQWWIGVRRKFTKER